LLLFDSVFRRTSSIVRLSHFIWCMQESSRFTATCAAIKIDTLMTDERLQTNAQIDHNIKKTMDSLLLLIIVYSYFSHNTQIDDFSLLAFLCLLSLNIHVWCMYFHTIFYFCFKMNKIMCRYITGWKARQDTEISKK